MSSTATTTTSIVHLPLTTTFIPDPSCLSTYVSNGTYTVFYLGPIGDSACYPSGWALTSTNYFSPGRCPSGYFGATTSLNSINTVVETIVTCCPIGYQYWATPFITNYYCGQNFPAPTTVTALKVDNGSTAETVDSYAFGGVNAASVQVRWQSTDFQGSSASQGTNSPTPVALTTATATAQDLSKSAKIGIGIGIPLIVVGILGIILLLRRRRQQMQDDPSHRPSNMEPQENLSSLYSKPELEATNKSRSEPQILPAELFGRPLVSGTRLESNSSCIADSVPETRLINPPAISADPIPAAELGKGELIKDRTSMSSANRGDLTTSITADANQVKDRGADNSVDALQMRVQKVKEERERLVRINELNRLEESLEREVAARKQLDQ